jgi:protein O-mannosyl-transferase
MQQILAINIPKPRRATRPSCPLHFVRMKRLPALLLLTLAIVAAYAPAIRNGFVWDDTALVLRDPLIRSWRLVPEGFQHFLFTDATASDFYRPLQRALYTAEYAAFAFAPAGYHVISIACHVAGAFAFFLFATELLRLFGAAERGRGLVPFVASLVWAVHPLHTSAVAYISGCADPLASAFGFAGLYCALRSLRTSGRSMYALTIAAGAACLLSGLSKEAGLVFPALWLAILLLQKNRRAIARAAIMILFVFVSYLSLRLPAEHVPPPPATNPMPLLVRPIIFARAVAEYTGLIGLPITLRMERDVETHPSGFGDASVRGAAWRELQTLAGIVVIAGFLYWLMRERKDRPIFACLVLTMIAYLPISGAVRLNASVAEHWLYLPSTFLFLAFALAAARWFDTPSAYAPQLKRLVVSATVVWVLFLGARTFVRTLDWKDQQTFLVRTIATGSDSARMLINLGGLEMNQGHFDAARKHLESALEKEPNQPLAIINLAALCLKQRNFACAHDLLRRAKEMPLVEAPALEMEAVLESQETGHANLLRMRLAARSGPPDWEIEKRYVNLLDETGATDAAIAELQHCLATEWYRADSWQLLSTLQEKVGRKAAAADALQMAHRYDLHLDANAARS